MTENIDREVHFARNEEHQTNDVHSAFSSEAWSNDVASAARNVLNAELGSAEDTYRGLHNWLKDDIVGNLFPQIGALVSESNKAASTRGRSDDVAAAAGNILNSDLGTVEDTYKGLHKFWKDELGDNLSADIGRMVGKSVLETPPKGTSEDKAKAANKVLNAPLGSVEDTYRAMHKF